MTKMLFYIIGMPDQKQIVLAATYTYVPER